MCPFPTFQLSVKVIMTDILSLISQLDEQNMPGADILTRLNAWKLSGKPFITVSSISVVKPSENHLSRDQEIAFAKLKIWLSNSEPYFVLRGFAGSGKTFLLRLLNKINSNIYYSAPTNKATKEVERSIGREAKTIYSTLGLRMEQQEDKLVLVQAQPPYFPRGSVIVIDETSMVGSLLYEAVDTARSKYGLKILFVGDPAQLPPIGEKRSVAWSSTDKPECRATLKQVMRYDNQILKLATALRKCIKDRNYVSPIVDDNDGVQGVFVHLRSAFKTQMLDGCTTSDLTKVKVLAWTNRSVDRYNRQIRDRLNYLDDFNVGDLISLASPIEKNGVLIGHTDDEFTITSVQESNVNIGLLSVSTWQLSVKGDKSLVLQVARDEDALNGILSSIGSKAKKAKGADRKRLWKEFWSAKNSFNSVRFSYALTCHRAQGSTYHTVWLDQQDILTNSNKEEAFKCLHVACTRASNSIKTF
jgi:exodeoxyribonuclease V